MLYPVFEYLEHLNIPGAGMFQYISFRAACAVILSLFISIWSGKRIINFLRRKQVGEDIRDLGLDGQIQKKGTPTMGGIIIILAILIPVLLFCRLDNIYILLMIISTVWLGVLGFLDDYIKVFKKHKEGLQGRFKVIAQVGLGLIVGLTLYLSPDAVIRERPEAPAAKVELSVAADSTPIAKTPDVKSTRTTIPFFKNNEFNYAWFGSFSPKYGETIGWIVFILVCILIVTSVSNGVNLTDGLDGLATGTCAISAVALGAFAYVSGNIIFSDFLNIMYIPQSGELVVFSAAFIGALVGFLWYNSYPATVFMGDTGSLSLGGIIAVLAIVLHKELLLPLLCGIFLMESLSVIIQVTHFKWTKRRTGVGQRYYLMAPLHHHYQKKGIPETKIVTRFWIVGIALAVLAVVTLKIR